MSTIKPISIFLELIIRPNLFLYHLLLKKSREVFNEQSYDLVKKNTLI
jgi:hypothetical protein